MPSAPRILKPTRRWWTTASASSTQQRCGTALYTRCLPVDKSEPWRSSRPATCRHMKLAADHRMSLQGAELSAGQELQARALIPDECADRCTDLASRRSSLAASCGRRAPRRRSPRSSRRCPGASASHRSSMPASELLWECDPSVEIFPTMHSRSVLMQQFCCRLLVWYHQQTPALFG